MPYLDQEGVKYLWSKISMEDYPNNETLIAILNAIDETKANKDETSAAITALDNEIEATNEALKTKVNNSDIVNDAILAGSTKIPTAGLVHSFVKGEIAIPEAIQLQVWSQEDGWYHVTSTLQVSNDKFIKLYT